MNSRKRLKKNLKKIKDSSQSLNVFGFFFNPVGSLFYREDHVHFQIIFFIS